MADLDNVTANAVFKDIVQRHTINGKFNLANAMIEIEDRLIGLEEAMAFFSNWYNSTQRVNILVSDDLKKSIEGNTSGLIL